MGLPDTITLARLNFQRLINPSSLVAKISPATVTTPGEPVTLASLRLGAGDWIVQAKADMRATGGHIDPSDPKPLAGVDAGLDLVATTGGDLASDESIVSTDFRPATVVVMIGIHASTTALLELKAFKHSFGDQNADFRNIVLTATRHDELTLLLL